jgi:ABC-type nickel/cobalt efflux system permease component RcnA
MQGTNLFKDTGHLVRLAAVMLIALVGFLVLRAAVIPKSFGEYGHFRGNALQEIASRPIAYAGRGACESCHVEVVDQKRLGRHAKIACETCHGPQAKHADDPSTGKPPKPNVAVLCARCHEANSAKPTWMPQVATAEHSGGVVCDTCHQPHHPKIELEGKK